MVLTSFLSRGGKIIIKPPTSHAARVQPYLWVLQDAGVDIAGELDRRHLASRILDDPDIVIASRPVSKLILDVARKEGIEDIAILGAERDGVQNLEPHVKAYLLGATTLKQLLDRYCKLAKKYIPYRVYTVETEARLARICTTVTPGIEREDWLRVSDWANVLLLLKVLRYVLGQNFKPEAITFQTRSPLTVAEQELTQGIQVLQGWTTTSIVLSKDLLATPLPRSVPSGLQVDAVPVDAVPVKTDVSDFPGLLRELVKPCLSEDWLDIHAIAEMTRCSARSLQRQLTAAGTNFSEVLDEARLEVAKPLLANESERLIDVAFEAGYTDPAHFSRAFRRIAGMTPSQYRKSKAFVRAA